MRGSLLAAILVGTGFMVFEISPPPDPPSGPRLEQSSQAPDHSDHQESAPPAPPAPPLTTPLPVSGIPPLLRLPGRRARVVIDPGHGGIDEGGRGRFTTDRDVAFAVALDLKRILDADPRVEVFLTRDGNRFVSLDNRVAFARGLQADAFVSLHANAFGGQSSTGVEVFHASESAAARERSRAFQAEGIVARKGEPPVEPTVGGALRGLRILGIQRATLYGSGQLARLVHDRIARRTGQRARGTRRTGYRVLMPHEFPSCLVELGYLSNRAEEALMTSPAWQRSAALGVAEGLTEWLEATRNTRDALAPPPAAITNTAGSTVLAALEAARTVNLTLSPPRRESVRPAVARRQVARRPDAGRARGAVVRAMRPVRRAAARSASRAAAAKAKSTRPARTAETPARPAVAVAAKPAPALAIASRKPASAATRSRSRGTRPRRSDPPARVAREARRRAP